LIAPDCPEHWEFNLVESSEQIRFWCAWYCWNESFVIDENGIVSAGLFPSGVTVCAANNPHQVSVETLNEGRSEGVFRPCQV
jgi:hypothetical protein